MTEMDIFTIQASLKFDEEFLYQALLYLYEQQEEDEQEALDTHYTNDRGFNKADSFILSQYAQALEHRHLTSDEQTDASRRMLKYSKQLLRAVESGFH